MATRKPGHRADGTFDGTAPPRNGGRRPLPWDLLDGHIGDTWAMLVACASGNVMPTAKGNRAVEEMAKTAPLPLRKEAANELLDRVHGKAPAAPVEASTEGMTPAMRALLALAGVETKEEK